MYHVLGSRKCQCSTEHLICDYSTEDRVYVVWVAASCIHVCWVRASCVDTYMDTCVGYQHRVHVRVRVYTCIHDVQPSYIHVHVHHTRRTCTCTCTRYSYPTHLYTLLIPTTHVYTCTSVMYIAHYMYRAKVVAEEGRKLRPNQTTHVMHKHTHMMKRTLGYPALRLHHYIGVRV